MIINRNPFLLLPLSLLVTLLITLGGCQGGKPASDQRLLAAEQLLSQYPDSALRLLGPAIDSGLVCTLTSIPIIIAGNYVGLTDPKGLYVALGAWGQLLPGIGHLLLMVIVFFFAFSTMFSYSYYGQKCTNYLFGAHNVKWYNYYYLAMIVVAAMIPLKVMVSIMDLAFALMALCTMFTIIRLAPRVKRLMKTYFKQ